MVTVEQFSKCFPKAHEPQLLVDAINRFFPKYGIAETSLDEFLAECGHESQGFTRFEENLNYGASGLIMTWPKRFNAKSAQEYSRQPEKIANSVYGGRLGNGNEASGDGWRFRGSGAIQLTGRDAHTAFAAAIGLPLENVSAYLRTAAGAIESACWFWSVRGLDKLAEVDFVALTKKINGGTIGLEEREELHAKAEEILA
jgi:putative chitinase